MVEEHPDNLTLCSSHCQPINVKKIWVTDNPEDKLI